MVIGYSSSMMKLESGIEDTESGSRKLRMETVERLRVYCITGYCVMGQGPGPRASILSGGAGGEGSAAT